jgi:hypothetical protein
MYSTHCYVRDYKGYSEPEPRQQVIKSLLDHMAEVEAWLFNEMPSEDTERIIAHWGGIRGNRTDNPSEN